MLVPGTVGARSIKEEFVPADVTGFSRRRLVDRRRLRARISFVARCLVAWRDRLQRALAEKEEQSRVRASRLHCGCSWNGRTRVRTETRGRTCVSISNYARCFENRLFD